MNVQKSIINNLRGIVSDWLLSVALNIAPQHDKEQLALAISNYFKSTTAAMWLRSPSRT